MNKSSDGTQFLSASTLTALSNASSSLLDTVDLDLVEEIIQRAPRTATSFPLVYRAYGQVLEENGLSPSTDTAYYQFLLKLGVIRATTWGGKWDLYKTTHTIASRHSPRIKVSSSTNARVAETKARLPFLASASSDLDEGFDDPATYDGDAESLVNVNVLRPSPRKVLAKGDGLDMMSKTDNMDQSRSLVGYTPTSTLDYDAISLNPPIRTSTPVYAQEKGRTTPPLPPYFVSDVGEVFKDMDTASTLDDSNVTLPTRHWTTDEKQLIEEMTREMVTRADEFYQTGLIGRCWDVWTQSFEWVKKTTEQIDSVRSNILLRQTLAKWHHAHQHHLSLPGTADRHRQLYLQSQALHKWMQRLKERDLESRERERSEARQQRDKARSWKKWRMVVVRRRTDRWEKDMRKREKAFVQSRNNVLLATTLEHWYETMRDRVGGVIADDMLTRRAMRGVFDHWLKQAVLRGKLNEWMRDQERLDVSHAFSVWRRSIRLVVAEKQSVHQEEGMLVRKIWDQWRVLQQNASRAQAFDEIRIKRLFMTRLVTCLRRYQSLREQAVQKHRKSVLKGALHIWKIRERGQLYENVKAARLVKQAFAKWMSRRSKLIQQEARGDQLAERFAQASLHRHFSQWRAVLGKKNQLTLQAVLTYETFELKLVSKLFVKWLKASRKVQSDITTAQTAHAFFVQRQALRVWKLKFAVNQREKMIESRRLATLKESFDAWKHSTTRSLSNKQAIIAFQVVQNKRTLAQCLSRWTTRVIELKSRDHDVTKQHNATIKQNALSKWIHAAQKIADRQILAQSFIQVHSDEYNKRILPYWRDTALRHRQLRLQVDQSRVERENRLVSRTFTFWRDRVRERALAPFEEEVANRHEDALLFAIWDKWKDKSSKLPYITFTKQRIVKSAWAKWRRALDVKKRELSIALPRDHNLLADVFVVWQEATSRRLSLSASRRRGRIRPGSLVESTKRIDRPAHRAFPTTLSRRATVDPSPRALAVDLPRRPRSSLPYKHDDRPGEDAESVMSEPAYSRLRSELYGRRRTSDEQVTSASNKTATSELVKQLRGTLNNELI